MQMLIERGTFARLGEVGPKAMGNIIGPMMGYAVDRRRGTFILMRAWRIAQWRCPSALGLPLIGRKL